MFYINKIKCKLIFYLFHNKITCLIHIVKKCKKDIFLKQQLLHFVGYKTIIHNLNLKKKNSLKEIRQKRHLSEKKKIN